MNISQHFPDGIFQNISSRLSSWVHQALVFRIPATARRNYSTSQKTTSKTGWNLTQQRHATKYLFRLATFEGSSTQPRSVRVATLSDKCRRFESRVTMERFSEGSTHSFPSSRSNLLEWLPLNKFLSCFWRCRIFKKSPNQRLCKSLKNHTLPVVLSVFVSGAWATHRHQCRLRPVPHRLQRGGERCDDGWVEDVIEDGGKSDDSFQRVLSKILWKYV